jgi:hypothetical protein
MSPELAKLIADARADLLDIEGNRSPAFRRAAARSLEALAKEIAEALAKENPTP